MKNNFISSLIASDSHYFIFASLCNKFLSLVIAVILTRHFTTSEYSQLAIIVAWVAVIAPVFSLGSNQAILRLGTLQHRASDRDEYVSSKFFLIIVIYCLFSTLAVLAYIFSGDDIVRLDLKDIFAWVFAYLVFHSLSNYLLSTVRIVRGNKAYSTFTTLVSFASVCSTYWFIQLWGLKGYFCGLTFVQVILFISLLPSVKFAGSKHVRRMRESPLELKEFFGYGLSVVAANLISQLSLNVDILMLGHLGHSDTVGVYRNASVLIVSLLSLSAVVVSSQFVQIVKLGSENTSQVNDFYKQYLVFAVIAALIIIVTLYFTADFLLVLLFGESYRDSASVLRILSIIIFPAFLVRIPLGNIFSALGFSTLNVILAATSVGLNIGLNWYLIPAFGNEGAAFGTVVSLLICSILYVYAWRGKYLD